jgi:hypothetical protein
MLPTQAGVLARIQRLGDNAHVTHRAAFRTALVALAAPGAVVVANVASSAVAPIDAPARATAPAQRVFPSAGTTSGVALPAAARPVDTSRPDRVVGSGTPASCTSKAVVDAVARGGIITFDCGPATHTIVMLDTAKVVNTSRDVVLDGGGRVVLSGADQRRILYMNTCDRAQIWTTSHCQNQELPRLTIQRMTFVGGNSTGDLREGGGGGAVFVRGGQLKVVESVFARNRCDPTGPDLGGGALRVLSQFAGRPAMVATSTFTDNTCSNGGALSSIGVSWTVYNSLFTGNDAIGLGANPSRSGTPGGGSGGAIYLDGNFFTLDLIGSTVRDNTAREGGPAIFFVSNDRSGVLRITDSTLQRNVGARFGTPGFPGIFFLGSGSPQIVRSTLS